MVLTKEEVTFGSLCLEELAPAPLVLRSFSRKSTPLWLCCIVNVWDGTRSSKSWVLNFNPRMFKFIICIQVEKL